MQNLNSVTLEGFLTEDPKFRPIRDGVEFGAFRMATNHDYRDDKGDLVERAQYHNIVVKIAPTVKAMKSALNKGSYVLVQGRLEHRSYDDANGHKQHISEVVANPYIGFVSWTGKSGADAKSNPAQRNEQPEHSSNASGVHA